jgi:hypothetical protein
MHGKYKPRSHKGRDYLEDLGEDMSIILESVLEKYGVKNVTVLNRLEGEYNGGLLKTR